MNIGKFIPPILCPVEALFRLGRLEAEFSINVILFFDIRHVLPMRNESLEFIASFEAATPVS
jgi:hypothetical protein